MKTATSSASISANRIFIVTYAGLGSGKYTENQKLSFPKGDKDDAIASKVNWESGLQYLDLGYTGKNEKGEWCFATRMDGMNFGNVLKIKEEKPD